MFASSLTFRRVLNPSSLQQFLPAFRCSSTSTSPFPFSDLPSKSSSCSRAPILSSLPPRLFHTASSSTSPTPPSSSNPHRLPSVTQPILRSFSSTPLRDLRHSYPPLSAQYPRKYQVGKSTSTKGSGDPSKQGKWTVDPNGPTFLSKILDWFDGLDHQGVAFALIMSNVAVFALWWTVLKADDDDKTSATIRGLMYRSLTVSWAGIQAGDYQSIVFAMFSHQSPIHLMLNMFALWTFGPVAMEILGVSQFVMLYLSSGIAANYFAATIPPTWFGANAQDRLLGASGAIFGILGFLSACMPRIKFVALPIPGIGLTGLQLIGGTCVMEVARLAWADWKNPSACGHLTGLFFGIVFFQLMKARYARSASTGGLSKPKYRAGR